MAKQTKKQEFVTRNELVEVRALIMQRVWEIFDNITTPLETTCIKQQREIDAIRVYLGLARIETKNGEEQHE